MKTRSLTTVLASAYLSAMLALTGASVADSPIPVASVNIPPKVDPVMNEELMGRLIKYTTGRSTGRVSAPICKELQLCDGTADMTLKLAQSDAAGGVHLFGLPPGSKDVLFIVMHDAGVDAYLADKTGKLITAVVSRNGIARRITNENAAEGFKKELSLFAGEAADLPPTGNE